MAFQWNRRCKRDEFHISLTSVATNQSGAYSVTITNIAGSTNSEATLSVNPASLPRFLPDL